MKLFSMTFLAFALGLSSRRAAAFQSILPIRSTAGSFRVAPSSKRCLSALSATSSSSVPMTLLSGFLGTGKTSALQHLLESPDHGLKIGVIVNDVASVNIDSKLVNSSTSNAAGLVELQNGCACCSLADELFASVDTLLSGDRSLDAIVVELSGVADPMAIQSNWNMAPVETRERASIQQVVTLVDAASFGTDYLTWDTASERPGWTEAGDDCAGSRKVAELLAEQVEAADLILLNKQDLASDQQSQVAAAVARALNEKATLVPVEFGRIEPELLLSNKKAACDDPNCSDPSHSHSHDSHEHGSKASTATSSEHDVAACNDPDCSDPSHSHSHSHQEEACSDPDCTDTSHSHSHSHATSTDQLGISSFVFTSDRPFDPPRLMALLNKWPVPVKDTLDIELLQEAQKEGYEIDGKTEKDSPFVGVVRSKGFCWFAPSKWTGANDDAWRHDTANYWSHAGKHFSITSAGKWWGTLSKEQMKKVLGDNLQEYDRILQQDFVSDEFGDRRQEIVFIGTGLDEAEITKRLGECLLTEKEMEVYRQKLQNYQDTVLTTNQSGLFDVGGIDHTDV